MLTVTVGIKEIKNDKDYIQYTTAHYNYLLQYEHNTERFYNASNIGMKIRILLDLGYAFLQNICGITAYRAPTTYSRTQFTLNIFILLSCFEAAAMLCCAVDGDGPTQGVKTTQVSSRGTHLQQMAKVREIR